MFKSRFTALRGPVLITGHTGFKGTWLSLLLDQLGVEHSGYSLSPTKESLFRQLNLDRSEHGIFADIRDYERLKTFLCDVRPEVVVHMAAQALVLEGFARPRETFEINVQGTGNVIAAASQIESVRTILVVTTDKVYKNDGSGKRFKESDPLDASDPYGASKVAAEILAKSWQDLNVLNDGPKIIIARAGNVIGGGDLSRHRLLPDIIRSINRKEALQIRNLEATRPWQHVIDCLLGYLLYVNASLQRINLPPALNFGPEESNLSVRDVLTITKNTIGEKLSVTSNESLMPEAERLELDSTLAKSILGWTPKLNQTEAILRTLDWWKTTSLAEKDPLSTCKTEISEFLKL